MIDCFVTDYQGASVAVEPINISAFDLWLKLQSEYLENVCENQGFGEKPGQFFLDYNRNGELSKVYLVVSEDLNPYSICEKINQLPAGYYHLETDDAAMASAVIRGWGFGQYRFEHYLKTKDKAKLVVDDKQHGYDLAVVTATYTVRDLINTPADDMGPTELAEFAEDFAEQHNMTFDQLVGDVLLSENFPTIHIVGRASHKAPRLIELNWGDDDSLPLITLVGKGVCFDTGGNNMKAAQFMRWMKKDMGGGAHVLGLAQLIMSQQLPVRLKVLVPAVENAVSGSAFRQGDVVTSRSGQSIEIGHTDAEGRVILADSLTYACESKPDLLIDFATLTGAARVAMGPTVTPVFSNRDDITEAIKQSGIKTCDEMWPMPLPARYKTYLKSTVADINNSASIPQAGCITAGLFLQSFVDDDIDWVHIDTYGWNFGDRTGGTEGGEALGLAAVMDWLMTKYQS